MNPAGGEQAILATVAAEVAEFNRLHPLPPADSKVDCRLPLTEEQRRKLIEGRPASLLNKLRGTNHDLRTAVGLLGNPKSWAAKRFEQLPGYRKAMILDFQYRVFIEDLRFLVQLLGAEEIARLIRIATTKGSSPKRRSVTKRTVKAWLAEIAAPKNYKEVFKATWRLAVHHREKRRQHVEYDKRTSRDSLGRMVRDDMVRLQGEGMSVSAISAKVSEKLSVTKADSVDASSIARLIFYWTGQKPRRPTTKTRRIVECIHSIALSLPKLKL